MELRRTNLIMEFGPYGSTTSGMAAPIGVRNFGSYPFMPNMELLKQKDAEANRRRERLRQLALGWFFTGANTGVASGGSTNASVAGGTAGAGPGRLF